MITKLNHVSVFVEFTKEPTKEFYGLDAIFKDDSGNWFSLGGTIQS